MTERPWRDAEWFATLAHWSVGHRRKYSQQPYIVHPLSVARMVYEDAPEDVNAVKAALLHDTVEDTGIGILTIERRFGQDVATLVEGLTDYQTPADGNRAFRKKNVREKIGRSCNRVKRIKTADCLDNGRDIVGQDRVFAKVYLKEIEELVPYLEGGSEQLLKRLKVFLAIQNLLLD